MATSNLQYRRLLSLEVAKDENFDIVQLRRQLEERAAEHVVEISGSFRIAATTTKGLDFGRIVTAEVLYVELESGQVDIRVDDPGTKATGQITVVAVASLVDGEIFTIDDGEKTAVVFEYDVTGDGVQAGRQRVNVSAVVSAADVALVTALAIETARVAGLLDVSASSDGVTADVALEATLIGPQANVAITEGIANGGFVVTGMSGGTEFPLKLKPAIAEGGTPIFLNEGIEATKIELRNPVTGGEACGFYMILGRIT